jgi:two-component system C4-dicarboxylate transport sensor histidine kinase DctB
LVAEPEDLPERQLDRFTITPPWQWRRWLVFAGLAAILLATGNWAAGHFGRAQALAERSGSAAIGARLYVSALASELEKQRSLPFVLAQDADVRAVLLPHPDAAALQQLDEKLAVLSAGTRAAVIYLLNADGVTVAASNWREPTSFIGSNYNFRPYFRDALQTGSGLYFALSTVSHRPGLYLARRIEGADGPLGVVVVKVEFDAIEAEWGQAKGPVLVTDARGVILITSIPAWRFRTLAPIPLPDKAATRDSLQFGVMPLEPLELGNAAQEGDALLATIRLPPTAKEIPVLRASVAVPEIDWTLHYWLPIAAEVELAVIQARLIAILSILVVLAGIGILLRRREYLAAELAMQSVIRHDLESRVAIRTDELQGANARLRGEIEERHQAQLRLQQLQDELIRANKLAVLGQITASVAHEINQPLTAIRNYTDNSLILAARGDQETVQANLHLVIALTERVGIITQELKNFARKPAGTITTCRPAEAIEGAMLLVGHRLRQQGIMLRCAAGPVELRVAIERIKLEQVLVNLLQNALDALAGRPDAGLDITTTEDADLVQIIVADNGPGIAAGTIADLFTPFVTTKPDGLGLGLVISRDIINEQGGTLHATNGAAGGAVFTISLRRAS